VQSEKVVETRSNVNFKNSIDDLAKHEDKESSKHLARVNPFTVHSEKKINSFGSLSSFLI
jgi:hypothetical protein